jgi:acyl-CoA-binding protein
MTFEEAQVSVKTLPKTPDNTTLLELYALFKQGTAGDVAGARPGMLDIRGRAKYDAWAKKKGTAQDAARTAYVTLVSRLLAAAQR